MVKFINREKEISRLVNSLSRKNTQVIVMYGRRRCGKTTLLREVLHKDCIFYTADMREASLQIASLSKLINKMIPGFDRAGYPDWESLIISMNRSLNRRIVLCLDEFPYLVKNSPELPSLIQKIMDERDNLNFHLILCGSSQQMMQGITLNSNSPLYGRCDEILRVNPLTLPDLASWFQSPGIQAVEEFGVWGGVPRYWELRKHQTSLEEAVKYHILDSQGILYDEPERLFTDEMRTSIQAFSVISLIATGSNRLSEIAARLNKPATQLSRILTFLTDLGYIRREIPFGESEKSTKKSRYKINDPFLNFYFSFILPHRSLLGAGLADQVWTEIHSGYNQYLSEIWEEECRKKLPFLDINGLKFLPGSRWWGTGIHGKPLEIDLVARSADRSALLIAEAKWTQTFNISQTENLLRQKIDLLPFIKDQKVIKALFLRSKPRTFRSEILLFDADDVCA